MSTESSSKEKTLSTKEAVQPPVGDQAAKSESTPQPVTTGSTSTSVASEQKPQQPSTGILQPDESREFKFVNTSSGSLGRRRPRMRASFKASGFMTSEQISKLNQDSVVIEQTLDPSGQTDVTSKYVFQVQVKRPPGRPRKHIQASTASQSLALTTIPKEKRPQGRPRKHPEITDAAVMGKVSKKSGTIPSSHTHIISAQPQAPGSKRAKTKTSAVPIDTDLIDTSLQEGSSQLVPKPRGRGRPKKETPRPKEEHTDAASVAAAAVVAAHLMDEK